MSIRARSWKMFGLLAAGLFTSQVSAAIYPVDGDNAYTVNVLRRYAPNGTLMSSASGSLTGFSDPIGGPLSVIDGGGNFWGSTGGNDSSSAVWRVTMDQVYQLRKIQQVWDSNHLADTFEIYASTTGFVGMTQIVAPSALSFNQISLLASPVAAKFLEFRFTGAANSGFALLQEIRAFADATANAPLDSTMGYNIPALGSPAITATTANGGWNNVSLFVDQDLQGPVVAQANESSVVIDLGSHYKINNITTGMFGNGSWNAGGQIEISKDGVNYITVFNEPSNNVGTSDHIVVSNLVGRFVRITAHGQPIFHAAEMEIFATVPEPASMGLLTLGGLLVCRRSLRGRAV